MVTIATIVRQTLPKLKSYKLTLEESLKNALDISKNAFLHAIEAPISGIRGPPGTGKTKIMEGLVNDENVIIELENSNTKFIYIAPTNELVRRAFERALIPILQMEDGDVVKALSKIRIYGSTMPSPYLGDDLEKLANELRIRKDALKEILKRIVYGGVDEAMFIFSTEYQRASARSKSSHKFAMFVDEASKSPFYLPFNPISDSELRELAKGGSGVIHALTVVGDDRQTIAVGPEYQDYGKTLLVLPKIQEVLENLGLERQFTTLRTTFRLPSPSEEPIGEGFYGDMGGLQAFEDAKSRFMRVFRSVEVNERLRICKALRDDILWDKVSEIIEYAIIDINKPKPIIIVNTRRSIPAGEQSEPCRIKLGAYFALLLRCVTDNALGISVIAPYRELVDYTKYYYRRITRQARISEGNVKFLTVQSMLGGEDDIIISILGKEWNTRSEYTIYFREPENLNVQFSRHRIMHIVIGNAITLRNSAAKTARQQGLSGISTVGAKSIRKTLDVMFKLAGLERITEYERARNAPWKSEGIAALFYKITC